MELAFVKPPESSKTQAFISKNLHGHGVNVAELTASAYKPPLSFTLKRLFGKLNGLQESLTFNVPAAQNSARHIGGQLQKLSVQSVLATNVASIAYLDCQQPIVLWTDALYAGALGFMESFSAHSAATVEHANKLTLAALSRVRLAIFSSDWAARSALELYGISKEKVKVVPFGANIDCNHSLFDIKSLLHLRTPRLLKLLFVGKDWQRNGGDIVLQVAAHLHQAGQMVSVDIVGCKLPKSVTLTDYINYHGTTTESEKVAQLMREAHFLFVPSRAETYNAIFCEANAFGLPCLTSLVGGIGTIVRDNMNGMKFAFETNVAHYCTYIANLMQHYSQYEELALSSFNEYQTRLNWQATTGLVKQYIAEL